MPPQSRWPPIRGEVSDFVHPFLSRNPFPVGDGKRHLLSQQLSMWRGAMTFAPPLKQERLVITRSRFSLVLQNLRTLGFFRQIVAGLVRERFSLFGGTFASVSRFSRGVRVISVSNRIRSKQEYVEDPMDGRAIYVSVSRKDPPVWISGKC